MRLRDRTTVGSVTVGLHDLDDAGTATPGTTLRKAASLTTHVRVIGARLEDSDRDLILRKLARKFGKFSAAIERITIRLSDANGPKGGRDQIAGIKVVLRARPSVVVEERDAAFPRAVDRAIGAAGLAVQRSLQRRRLKPLHHRGTRTAGRRRYRVIE